MPLKTKSQQIMDKIEGEAEVFIDHVASMIYECHEELSREQIEEFKERLSQEKGCIDEQFSIINSTISEILSPDVQECAICFCNFEGIGQDAEPIARGECCERCYNNIVIPVERMALMNFFAENQQERGHYE